MKFKYFVLVLLCLIPTCLGMSSSMIDLSIKYLTVKGLRDVCLLSCENSDSVLKFTKAVNEHTLAVATVDISYKRPNYEKVDRCLQQKYSSIGILINANCYSFRDIMIYASQEMLFNSARKWFVVDEAVDSKVKTNYTSVNVNRFQYTNDLKAVFDHLNVSVDADVTVAVQKGYQGIHLYEVFNYGKIQDGALNINFMRRWSKHEGIKKDLLCQLFNEYIYYRRWNFQKLKLRMIIVMSSQEKSFDPSVLLNRRSAPGISVISLTSSMILNVISEVHNIRYKYSVVDRWIGSYKRNSTATVSNSLYFRKQDISPVIRLANFTKEYIDFLYPPLTSIETKYYYRIPTNGPGKFENQFLRPLTTGAWSCVIAMALLCVVALMMSSKIEKRPFPTQYALFSVIASICQQFFEDNSVMGIRQRTTGKMAVLVTGASCVLIYNYYTSSVVSWLLNGPPPSINSLQELLESPLELIFEDIGYTRSWLQMPDYYYNKRNAEIESELRQKKVLNKKKEAPLLVSIERGIEMVKAGGYAYHTEVDNANSLISRTFDQNELCELGSLQSMEKTVLYACVQKNSPYKEFYVWSLLRLLERGVISCIQDRTKAPDVSCEGSSPRALTLGGAAPAFIMLGAGYVLGVGIMILERIYYRFQHRL